ncbi:chromosome partition protein Smc [Methanobrevibacter cuticularis]|uniref:Chromosome partition protein Smc n=1 Tax=Methanobrevibacter cuticularis TaxID=47311 RepID=A0A166F7V8_9EURY|nr:hypothetical protein [Methanobrevibacter cuticularis]KZX17408.1 chromosome partition protein Smc [Methanobrevibacter cuticularis]
MALVKDNEKERLQNLVKSCLLEINQLKMDLVESEKEKSSLKNDEEVEKLKTLVSEKQEEINSLKTDLNNLQVILTKKESLLEGQNKKIEEFTNIKESFDDIKNSLEQDLINFKTQELTEHNEELKSTLNTITEKDEEIKSLLDNIKNLKERIYDLENNIASKDSLLELQKEIDSKDSEIKILKSSVADDSTIKSLEIELSNKDKRINELEQIQSSFNEIKTSLEKDIKQYKNKELEETNLKLQSSLDKIRNKDDKIKDLMDQVQSSLDKIRDKDDKIKDLMDQVESSLDKIRDKDDKIKDLMDQVQSSLDKIRDKDDKIKDLMDQIDQKKTAIQLVKDQHIPKKEYDQLKDELKSKDSKIKRLEEIKGLFSDLNKDNLDSVQKARESQDWESIDPKINNKVNNNANYNANNNSNNSINNKNGSNAKVVDEDNNINSNENLENLKKEIKSCKDAVNELEKIKKYYTQITSPPKADLTSFQSQIYYLIPDTKMSSQDIHSYIRKISFKNISYGNINNILRNLERKGYLECKERNGDESMWVKTNKK